jgi:hypothetical protein
MIGAMFVALATAWTVVVADAIAESARSDGRTIVVFGNIVSYPGSPAGIWVLIGGVLLALLLWAFAIAILRGQRLQRRVRTQLETGWRDPVGPRGAPPMPGGALPLSPEEPATEILELRRDDLLLELRQVQRELEAAQRLREQAEWHGRIEDALIVLPEFESEDELASRRTSHREPLEG